MTFTWYIFGLLVVMCMWTALSPFMVIGRTSAQTQWLFALTMWTLGILWPITITLIVLDATGVI